MILLSIDLIRLCRGNKNIPVEEDVEHQVKNGKRSKTEIIQLLIYKFKGDLLRDGFQEMMEKFVVDKPDYWLFHNQLRFSFKAEEFKAHVKTTDFMDAKMIWLYLLTLLDRGYIWAKVRKYHQDRNHNGIPWRQLLKEMGYSHLFRVTSNSHKHERVTQKSVNKLLIETKRVSDNVYSSS